MEFIKVVVFGLACLFVNLAMVSSDCTVATGEPGFDWPSVAGRWFIKKANQIVFDQYDHFIFNFQVLEDEVKATGTLRDGSSTLSFNGGWKIAEDDSSTLNAGFSEVLGPFNGTYTAISDPSCYFFTPGCTNTGNKEVLVIYFRDEHPTEECNQEAVNAYKEAGYNVDLLKEDNTFK